MKWITEITLNNFRGFGKPETITILKGNHLLIYGENGSGKSSIYHALKDLFASSVPVLDPSNKVTFKVNKFQELAGNDKGNVTIKISEVKNDNAPVEYKFNSSETPSTTEGKPDLVFTNKYRGFLDYKKMLKVHALEIPDNKTPNIFSLLIHDLLSEHKILDPKGGTTSVELLHEYNRIKKGLGASPPGFQFKDLAEVEDRINNINTEIEELEINGDADSFGQISELKQEEEVVASYRDKFKLLDELGKLSNSLINKERENEGLLRKVFRKANVYLRAYFKNKIKVDIIYTGLTFWEDKKNIEENIGLKVYYAGKEIESYHAFLNEARLSSLAICLYLASIKTFEPDPATTLKVLYLDDVFIGLDTSNRFPLLEIIKKEFINEGFQIFIATYDRQWFELARHWFENEYRFENTKKIFKCLELFVSDNQGNPAIPDYPILIYPSLSYIKKAEAHYEKKDFPAAANYLRKACEAELKRILPKHLTIKIDFEKDKIEILGLEALIDNFFKFMTKNNLNIAPFKHVKTYRKIIFNPLSHDDLETPLYRKEILDGIALINELNKIQSATIVEAKENAARPMTLAMKDTKTNKMHDYEIKVLENLQIIKQDAQPIQLSVIECEVIEVGTSVSNKYLSLNEAFDKLRIEREYPPSTDYSDFYKYIKVNSRKKLIDMMKF
ncbi:MAG: AAA family ATPase [Leptospiraceae bacterium]|nr:AAA family ATPase [Leptospiraceae bacterium]